MKYRKQRGNSDRRRPADSPNDAPQCKPSAEDYLSAALDHALRQAKAIFARRHQQTSSSAPAEPIDAIDSANDLIN